MKLNICMSCRALCVFLFVNSVFAVNRIPRKSPGFKIPLEVFSQDFSCQSRVNFAKSVMEAF